MIRDRLVCGVNHDMIQPRLLAEKDLTYEKAVELAEAVEAAEKNSKILKNGASTQTGIHQSSASTPKPKQYEEAKRGTPTCYRCGGPHLAPVCKFKDTICHYCQKKGHLARVCKSKNKSAGQPKKNFYVQDEQQFQDESYGMFTVRTDTTEPIMLDVCINTIIVFQSKWSSTQERPCQFLAQLPTMPLLRSPKFQP